MQNLNEIPSQLFETSILLNTPDRPPCIIEQFPISSLNATIFSDVHSFGRRKMSPKGPSTEVSGGQTSITHFIKSSGLLFLSETNETLNQLMNILYKIVHVCLPCFKLISIFNIQKLRIHVHLTTRND